MTPKTCADPVCNNDTQLCPNRVICTPIVNPMFDRIDTVVISLITMEFLLRVFTVWAVDSRYLTILTN